MLDKRGHARRSSLVSGRGSRRRAGAATVLLTDWVTAPKRAGWRHQREPGYRLKPGHAPPEASEHRAKSACG
jgi:hypothetical protein